MAHQDTPVRMQTHCDLARSPGHHPALCAGQRRPRTRCARSLISLLQSLRGAAQSGLPTEQGASRDQLSVGMVGGGDVKVATVEVESVDNMATLPVSRAHGGSDVTAEKNNVTNKEMELKKVRPQPLTR